MHFMFPILFFFQKPAVKDSKPPQTLEQILGGLGQLPVCVVGSFVRFYGVSF